MSRPQAFVAADDSQAIGGTGRVAPEVLAGGRSLAILEPVTEGVLAGALARWDEGPRIVWIETDDVGAVAGRGPPSPGPFGPERLVAGQPADGLLRLVVPSPGTIRVMTDQGTILLRPAAPRRRRGDRHVVHR